MIKNMKTSPECRHFIEQRETLQLTAYNDGYGYATIGYGHKGPVNGKPLVIKKTTITKAQADEIFANDLNKFESDVNKDVKVPLTQGQFDCLVSFTFNGGDGMLEELLTATGLNHGNYAEVPAHIALYNKATDNKTKKLIVSPGLVKRRKQEIAFWNKK